MSKQAHQPTRQSLRGKTALVTGASSGIGRALALVLAAEGVRMAVVGRSRDRLEKLAAEAGGAPLVLVADLARPAETDRVVDGALEHLGHIDILLPNAGLYVPGDISDGDPDVWDELLSVNVNSVFRIVRRVLPGMMARGSGDIVDLFGFRPSGDSLGARLLASKHAVQSFVHGLRRQVSSVAFAWAPLPPASCSTSSGVTLTLPKSTKRSRGARVTIGGCRRRGAVHADLSPERHDTRPRDSAAEPGHLSHVRGRLRHCRRRRRRLPAHQSAECRPGHSGMPD